MAFETIKGLIVVPSYVKINVISKICISNKMIIFQVY